MTLYKPGRQKEKSGARRPLGGFSAVPLGRRFQLDSYLGVIVVDRAKDPGREGFEEEAARLVEEGAEDAELYAEYGNLESGTAYWFGWTTPDGRAARTNLSRCTEAELIAFREAVNRAVEEALPEVQRRDERARSATDAGFYGLYRQTRAAPKATDFAGKKAQHAKGLQLGREAPDASSDEDEAGATGSDLG